MTVTAADGAGSVAAPLSIRNCAPPWSFMQALQPLSTRRLVEGRLSGAPKMPMSSPISTLLISSCATLRASVSEPKISRAETGSVGRSGSPFSITT